MLRSRKISLNLKAKKVKIIFQIQRIKLTTLKQHTKEIMDKITRKICKRTSKRIFNENFEDNLEENFGKKFKEQHEENLEEKFKEPYFDENLKLNRRYQINSEKDDNDHNGDNIHPQSPLHQVKIYLENFNE